MTLREAITRAHARGDTEERNRLMAVANQHVTVRELQTLLGCALDTAHRWTVLGRAQIPCSGLESAAPTSTLVGTTEIAPASAVTDRGRGTEPLGGPDAQ